jgi:adenylosuccinate lyase
MIERYSREEMKAIWSDESKFGIWLEIEKYACEAQNKLGIIPRRSLENILKKSDFNVDKILEIEKVVKHDVIAFLTNVAEYVGDDSRFIHLGMTSSDVLDTALSVQLKKAGELLLKDLKKFSGILKQKAKKYKTLVQIGRTHGIHAEPVTLGLKFALWYDEFNRNIKRMQDAIENISVGQISGAVGTYEHISPLVEKHVCKKLGLETVKISTQIIQRDRHAHYMSVLAIIASSLDKIATEIRHLQKTEVLELEEKFTKGQKGSSAMPHKKNPITCEQMSGLARVIRGNSIAALENIPLWHERDISHSSVERIIFPDSTILLDYMLDKMCAIIDNIVVYKENIDRNLHLTKGLIFSQNLLLALIDKKMRREDAYKIVQTIAMHCWDNHLDFAEEVRNNSDIKKFISGKELDGIFDYTKSLNNVNYIFKRLGL